LMSNPAFISRESSTKALAPDSMNEEPE